MKKSGASQGQSGSELISKRIAELGDWRGETLSRMRKLIKKADPDVVEDWKWMGTPIWSHDGRVSEGSGPSLQLESRRKRTPRDRHPRRRRSRRVRLQGARSPSGRPQRFRQVETFALGSTVRHHKRIERRTNHVHKRCQAPPCAACYA